MDDTKGFICDIIAVQGADWGRPAEAGDPLYQALVEFVSADPTGPLTLHQARNGVVGDALANLLVFSRRASRADREFYVNDAASPLRTIARWLWTEGATEGTHENRTGRAAETSDTAVPLLPPALLASVRKNPHAAHYAQVSFEEAAPFLQSLVVDFWMEEHKKTLDGLNISFDRFFKESDLHGTPQIANLLHELHDKRMASDEYGALWLRSSRIRSDERDYVLRRADGSVTYLAADLAYHKNKFDRGYGRLVDVWNSDHAAYVGRTRAGLSALGLSPSSLDVVLCETVRLVKDGAEIKEANGDIIQNLVRELGAGAVRFLLLHSRENEPLLLDADAARAMRGSFYTVRTACKSAVDVAATKPNTTKPEQSTLLSKLADFPYVVQDAVQSLSPFLMTYYAVDLAQEWNASSGANGVAAQAVKQTLQNIFHILGVTLDEKLDND